MAGKSAGRRGPMDPDTYQKRDVKRRLSASEKGLAAMDARLTRVIMRTERRLVALEEWANLKGDIKN